MTLLNDTLTDESRIIPWLVNTYRLYSKNQCYSNDLCFFSESTRVSEYSETSFLQTALKRLRLLDDFISIPRVCLGRLLWFGQLHIRNCHSLIVFKSMFHRRKKIIWGLRSQISVFGWFFSLYIFQKSEHVNIFYE